MKKCSNCGVALEKNMNFCPLCGEPVMQESEETPEYIQVRKRKQEEAFLTDFQRLKPREKRKLIWEIAGIILVSGIIITFIIDFAGSYDLSWSKYPMIICAILFANISFILRWYHKLVLSLSGSFVSTSALLVILDLMNGVTGWGINLGIPLLAVAYIIVFLLIINIKAARKRGLNIIAFSLMAAGLLTICTEGIISIYTVGSLQLEWSLITMASVLPIAVLLLFIHYRLKKGTDLKRFFHI